MQYIWVLLLILAARPSTCKCNQKVERESLMSINRNVCCTHEGKSSIEINTSGKCWHEITENNLHPVLTGNWTCTSCSGVPANISQYTSSLHYTTDWSISSAKAMGLGARGFFFSSMKMFKTWASLGVIGSGNSGLCCGWSAFKNR